MAHEADGIGEDHALTLAQLEPPQGRIEGREQLIGGIDRGFGQRVEQRRLAGVGVTDHRYGRYLRLDARLAALCATPWRGGC